MLRTPPLPPLAPVPVTVLGPIDGSRYTTNTKLDNVLSDLSSLVIIVSCFLRVGHQRRQATFLASFSVAVLSLGRRLGSLRRRLCAEFSEPHP